MIITAFSGLYTWILALEQVPDLVAALVMGLDVPVWVILLVVDIIILAIGFFVDVAPAIILLTPVFLPALKSIGVSPIQFGAILIVGMAVGLVTPPVGMCLNVVSTITKLDIVTIFRASIPFLIADVIVLLLATFIPALSLWLPAFLTPLESRRLSNGVYFPSHTGGRFSIKALIPSRASPVMDNLVITSLFRTNL